MADTGRASGTATTTEARQHARAQEAAALAAGPQHRSVPASSWPGTVAGVPADDVLWAEEVPFGGYGHRVLAAGTALRLTDTQGDGCVSLLLYNAQAPWERLNVADTAKVQWQVYTSPGQLLLSDQGRALATVLDDTSGHHDILYGTSSRARNEERYGAGDVVSASPAGRELFVLGAAKNGLERRDLAPSISFFKGVQIDDEGLPGFTGSADPGSSVTLRMEMPVIALLVNTAHPLDPRPEFTGTPVELVAWKDRRTIPVDPQWNATPEGRRAFENTEDYLKGRGIA